MSPSTATRSLSYNMRLAAEAAYQGKPLNPRWSLAAQTVYRGIWLAKHGQMPLDTQGTSTAPNRDLRPTTHHAHASPFVHKALQAWHLTYTDGEQLLILFPHHAKTDFVLNVAKAIAGERPFTMHPIQYGHFHIHWPTQDIIHTLYRHDIRLMDHNGMLHIPARLPKRPPQEQR